MDLSFLVNNPVVNMVVGAVGGGIIKFLYDSYKVKDLIAKGEAGIGNAHGLFIKKHVLDQIKDESFREITKQELKDAPDNYNRGWDMGLDGVTL